MDVLTVINTVGLILLLIIIFKDKLKNIKFNINDDKPSLGGLIFDDTFSTYEKSLLTKIHSKFFKYANDRVPLDIFYSVLWQESGGLISKDYSNDKIIGDNGDSVGYMQIYRYGALQEFNQRENKNYNFEDLKNESKNIEVGLHYLDYAIQKAYNQTSRKPLQWLVFKKYNGGLDETEQSQNSMANAYADKCYQKFIKVNKFVNLNYG